MPIRRYIITLIILLSSSATLAEPIWKDLPRSTAQANERIFLLDTQALVEGVDSINLSSSSNIAAKNTNQPVSLELPLPKGGSVKLLATEYSIMEEGASAYGDFRSWKVRGVDDPSISGVIDLSSSGFHGMLSMPGGDIIFVEPVFNGNQQQKGHYKSYAKSDRSEMVPFSCGVHSTDDSIVRKTANALKDSPVFAQRQAQNLKTYRLAMAATGEFTEFFGGRTEAMNAISSIVNEVNFIYERDLGIRLLLVNNNQTIVFTNSNTDPYVNSNESLLIRNTSVINSILGSGAYDIGHVLTRYTQSVGGVARLRAVCGADKGAGTTGSRNPSTAIFAIDFVAHELGHQLGADHTFNSKSAACAGGNRAAGTAFEPGGGSSVMAYAGICGVNNIANNSLPVFHVGSIAQIDLNTRVAEDCGVDTASINQATGNINQDPEITSVTTNLVVNAGDSFTLTGSAFDPDGDNLTYSWDQVDSGTVSDKFIDAGNNALFEVNAPSSSPSRTFTGRALTNRNLTFEFVVRDGRGGIVNRETTVTVINGSAPVANLLPLSEPSSGGSGGLDMNLLLWLFGISLLVLGRRQYSDRQRQQTATQYTETIQEENND